MTQLTDTLERIMTWYQPRFPEYAASFQPGLCRSDIDIVSQRLDLNFTEEFYELYQWSNGTNPIDNEPPSIGFCSFFWNPLEFLVGVYEEYREDEANAVDETELEDERDNLPYFSLTDGRLLFPISEYEG